MAENAYLLGIGYRHIRGGEQDFGEASKKVRESAGEAKTGIQAADEVLEHLQQRFTGTTGPAGIAVLAIGAVTVAVIAFVEGVVEAVKKAAEFQAAMTAVGRQGNLSKKEIAELAEGVEAMSGRLPVASLQLAQLAQTAVSLGVKGTENILEFTEVTAKLGMVSDVTGTEGAKSLGRLLTILGENTDRAGLLASTVVALGKAFFATESEIVEHTQAVARATSGYHLTGSEVLALGAVLASFGTRAQGSGQTIAAVFQTIEQAVHRGSYEMQALSEFSGKSAAEIKASWEKGPLVAFTEFLQRVRDIQDKGGNLGAYLQSVGLGGDENLRSLSLMAQHLDDVARAQRLVKDESRDTKTLNEDVQRTVEDLSAQWKILGNVLETDWQTIGRELVPAVTEATQAILEWSRENKDVLTEFGRGIGAAISFLVLLVHQADSALASLRGVGGAFEWIYGQAQMALAKVAEAAGNVHGKELEAQAQFSIDQGRQMMTQANATMKENVEQFVTDSERLNVAWNKLGSTIENVAVKSAAAGALIGLSARGGEPAPEGAPKPPPPGGPNPPTPEQLKAFEETRQAILASVSAAKQLAAAYGGGEVELAQLNERLEVTRRYNEGIKNLAVDQWGAFHRLVEEQVKAERGQAGALVIDDLERERASLNNLSEAQKKGVAAVTAATSANAVAQKQHQATATAASSQVERIKALIAGNAALVVSIDQENVAMQRRIAGDAAEREAQATLSDERARGAQASRDLATALEVEEALRQQGVESGTKSAEAIRKEIEARNARVLAMDSETAALKRQHDFQDELARSQASFLDAQQQRDATRQWGSEIAGVLQKYGLLSDATRKLSIEQRAQAIFREKDNTLTLQQIIAELTGQAALADAQARVNAETEIHQLQADKAFQSWANVFSMLSESMGGTSTALGRLAADFGGLIAALQRVRDAGVKWSADMAQAVAGVVGAVGGLLKDMNVGASNKTGGVSGLGGRLEGNYAGIGSMVGTVLGAVLAAVFSWGTGTAGGAALGGAIGTVVGAMISKAGDSASAALLSDGSIVVGESATKLNGAVHDSLIKIWDGVNSAIAGFGLQSGALPGVDIKIRDNIVRVIVGDMVRTFSTVQDAVSFAITESLKQIAAKGQVGSQVPPEVLKAIQNSHATDLQGLQADIDFAKHVAYYGLPAIVQQIDKTVTDYFTNLQRAQQLGLDTTKVTQEFVDQLNAMRDNILGIDRTLSPEEQVRRDAAAFNQKITLLHAEWTLKQADLEQSRAEIAGKIAVLQAKGVIAGQELDVEAETLKGKTAVVESEGQLLASLLEQLSAVDSAIAASKQLLATLPNLINDQEIQDAIKRIGRGRGGGTGDEKKGLLDQLHELQRAGLPDFDRQLLELSLKFKDLAEQAKKLGISEDEVKKAREAQVQIIAKQIRDSIKDYLPASQGGTYGLSDIGKQRKAIEDQFAEVRRQNDLLLKDEHVRALAKWQIDQAEKNALRALSEQVISGFGLPMEQARNKVAQLKDAVGFLREMMDKGVISASRFGDVFKQLQGQAEGELLGLAQGILQSMGQDQEAAKVKAALDEANFYLQVAQLNFLYQQYLALGLIGEGVKKILDEALGIINDPKNTPHFYAPTTPSYQQQGNQQDSTQSDNDRRRQEILNQIAEWNKLGEPDVTAQLRDLNDTFVSMRADAQRLGMDLGALQSAYGKAVDDFWNKALEPYESPETKSAFAQVQAIQDKFNAMVDAANRYGGDIERIERDRQEAVKQFWDNLLNPLKDYQTQLAGGNLSPLSPEQRLLQSRQHFDQLAAAALAGDTQAIQQLPGAIDSLLQTAQQYFGTGPAYQALFQTVQNVLGQVLALGQPGNVAHLPPSPVLPPNPSNVLPFPIAPPATVAAQNGGGGPSGGFSAGDSTDRMGRLLEALGKSEEQRRDDRSANADLRDDLSRLVKKIDEQTDQIESLSGNVEKLTSFVESLVRRLAS